ncbi:hypothetical protein [Rhizobium sp. 18055]|jgi:hypothetical protein|uniref:hypothetical protein n=1 Tax=Rhizobium sp. 18055 TaxID=2681403 RepID=UPI001359D724|nr:hypothetical protein [Rhizobium sp. 18055]
MRALIALGMLASLACISAAQAPSQWQTYAGVGVDTDPTLQMRFDRTYPYCEQEAVRRGSPDAGSLWHVTALRSCMYRFGIVDRGSYAYPANAVFYNFLDR